MNDNNIKNIHNCYGCGVCAISCPKNIISIRLNEDGFYEPQIDEENHCIHCGLCLKVCAFSHQELATPPSTTPTAYAAWSTNERIRTQSSSGGVSFEIASYLLSQGYNACGVKYNIPQKRAEHFIAKNANDFIESIGSKYIPSYTVDAFSNLSTSQKYFIVGTPCQIDSLRRYIKLKRIEENFVLLDFFCHGVPSMNMWYKYLAEMNLNEIHSVSWRNKQTGWHDSWVMTIINSSKKIVSSKSKGDLFYAFFLKNRCLGKACYENCKYKYLSSSADIRIGDLWGNEFKKEDKGVSGVLINTSKGFKIFQDIKNIKKIEKGIEVVTEAQMKKLPAYPTSYNYVRKKIPSDTSLRQIDQIASVLEFVGDFIPYCIKNFFPIISRRIKRLCK